MHVFVCVWPQAILLTQHLFPRSLPLCAPPAFLLSHPRLFPAPTLSSSFPPSVPKASGCPNLLPHSYYCLFSLPAPSFCLISFQIFAWEWSYSSSVLSCPAKIRWCPGLLTLYYWAELALLQEATIHIITTRSSNSFYLHHHDACLTSSGSDPD